MATIVREEPAPWWGTAAANVLGGLIGNFVNRWQENEQNRKINAYQGALDEALDALRGGSQEQAAPSGGLLGGQDTMSMPDGYNANGWANAFHQGGSPLAQYDLGTRGIARQSGELAGLAQQASAPSRRQLTAQEIQREAARLAASPRFAMLGQKTIQDITNPYLVANEQARREAQREALARDFTGAEDNTGRKNALVSGLINQWIDNANFNSIMNGLKMTPSTLDVGGSIIPATFDEWAGQMIYGNPWTKTLTPQQVADNAYRDKAFTEDVRRNNRDYDESRRRWQLGYEAGREDTAWSHGIRERELTNSENAVTHIQTMPDGHVYGITPNGGTIRLSDIPGLTEVQKQRLEANAKTRNELVARRDSLETTKRTYVNKGYATDSPEVQALTTQIEGIDGRLRELDNDTNNMLNSINTKPAADISEVSFRGHTPNGGKYRDIINKYSEMYDVDSDLIVAMMMQESGGRANAKSPAGAMGLMQLMPATAAELGVTDPFDPDQNLRGGIEYIARQLRAFNNDLYKALWAYNAGPGNAKKGRMPKPSETRPYITRIINNYRRLKGLNTQSSSQQAVPPAGQTSAYNGSTPSTLPPVKPHVLPDITQQEYERYLREAEKGNLTGDGVRIRSREELDEYLRRHDSKVIGTSPSASPQTSPASSDVAPVQPASPDVPPATSPDVPPMGVLGSELDSDNAPASRDVPASPEASASKPKEAEIQAIIDQLNGEFGVSPDHTYMGIPDARDLVYRGPFYANPMDDPNLIPIPNHDPNEPSTMQLLGATNSSSLSRWADWARMYDPQRHWQQFSGWYRRP